MTRRWLPVVLAAALAACTPGSARRNSSPPPAAGTAPVAGNAPPGSGAHSARAPIESPHGTPIKMIALTAEGTAAITCDTLDSLRLWPTLDGTVEPRVVDLPKPVAFALASDPRGFLIALIDPVGGLLLEVVDRRGVPVHRAELPID